MFMNLKKDKCFRKHAKNLSSHGSQWKLFSRHEAIILFFSHNLLRYHLQVRFQFDKNQESRRMYFESCERNPIVFVVT